MAAPAKVQPSQLRSHGWMCIVAMMSSGPAGVGIGGVLAGPWHPPINEARPIAWKPPAASTPPMPTPSGPDDAGIEQGDAYTGPGVALPNLPTLREGVVEANLQLRRFVRPTDAVIAAWVRLEKAAARSGVLRDPAATPTEFTVKVLDRAPVDPEATRTLLGLYLRARFGGEQMTADDVTAALAGLAALAEPGAQVQPEQGAGGLGVDRRSV